ncbi:hypothetical protein [Mucilaginibacter xinganensis]|uniref:Uncharacterized protein n=1 Tax=Mucilaginibacter xinganensis TaxID=1234841 RepID=A0A223NWW8_9SPHI|nr:hypothetical protein [Mucilaginibacter xinganensis]ASU34373.1 hypothetical protein MuYL_2486 [Mucilaginibacter xinganensis]
MGVLAEMIAVEHQSELVDTTFKNAIVNQKAKRIKADAQAIKVDLSTNQRVNIRFNDDNFIQDYACELHRVFTYFIGLPIEQIKTVMDNLYALSITVQEPVIDYES